jgi:transposase InsO family protein
LFNQIIARFGIPREIVTDHGSHFQNKMMTELTSNLGLRQEHSSPYYPQANGQVEAVNKSLKTILQRTINSAKSNWHLMLYSTLWAYRTSVKTATSFSPFQLVYGLEAVLPIECQIPSLKLAVQLLPDTSPLEERYYILSSSMSSVVMQPWLTRLTNKKSSVSMIGPFILRFSLKATLS